MKNIIAALKSLESIFKMQSGFSLAEFMVAFAVSVIIASGSMFLLHHIATVGAEHRDETTAVLQVQFIGFWLSEDVVQGQNVSLGPSEGFPIVIKWTEWDGDRTRITYMIEGMYDEESSLDLWKMKRTLEIDKGSGYENYGTTVVSTHLDPGMTRCYWDSTEDDVLVLDAAAIVDRAQASGTYHINPRALE